MDVLVCQTGNCFITITWPSSRTETERDAAFQISLTYLSFFSLVKGSAHGALILGWLWPLISFFPNMSISCCRAERGGGWEEKTVEKGRVTAAGSHEVRMRRQQTGREMSYCIPEGDARMWNKHTQGPERAMKLTERKYSLFSFHYSLSPLPNLIFPHLCKQRLVICKLLTSYQLDSCSRCNSLEHH